jgi:hypothetical protein
MGSEETAGVSHAYADAALFLGMNSTDEALRIACKAFFAGRPHGPVVMSLEQVGRCDDVIWDYSRELQDAYYPFMDNLHTIAGIRREGYEEVDIRRALSQDVPAALPAHERLLLGMVLNRKGMLHTASPRLGFGGRLPVRPVGAAPASEPLFPDPLERLYRQSLALRVPLERL